MKGYDNLPLNHQLLLHLTFEEMTGLLAHDRAEPHHPHTLNGVPTWNQLANGLPYLAFDSTNPDWLDCPAIDTADLDFTAGDFSLAIWRYIGWPPALGSPQLFARGVGSTDGWELFYYAATRVIYFRTNQLGAQQITQGTAALGALAGRTWALIGVSRSGASARIYVNAKDVVDVAGTHVNPATSPRALHIAVSDNHTSPFSGWVAGGPCGPRIWGRALSENAWAQLFEYGRHWLGV